MTFSICVYDEESGEVGVGALTAMMGVGKLIAHSKEQVGAAASQATMNPYLALDGLELIATGRFAEQALNELIAQDEGRDYRQVGIVDTRGGTAAWTGSRTPGWAGHMVSGTAVAQGNRLVGQETLEATLAAYWEHEDLDLGHRLLHALEAGEATGADKQGTVSGTINVMGSEAYPLWDVRVDHAEDPAAELRRLVEEFEQELRPMISQMSTREDYVGEMTREEMADDEQ